MRGPRFSSVRDERAAVRGTRDPYGLAPRPGLSARLASAVGLLLIALATVYLFYHPIPLPGRSGGNGGAGGVARTPTPSNVVVPNPSATVPGSLVYAKGGNLWIQTGASARQLVTSAGGSKASSPAWSPDGQWIYYIDTRQTTGHWPPGNPSLFDLTYPVLVRIHPDGSGRQDVLSGLFSRGPDRYFYWILQPSISPDGKTAAVISDGPNPDSQDTVLQFVDLATGTLQQPPPKLAETAPLGHTDPVWSPDGSTVAFVMEGREGVHGAPSIWLYDVAGRTARQLSASGYRNPSWSPDGRYLAASRVTPTKTDVVILDASSGRQVAQVTTDGSSWDPVWSASNTLVFLNVSGQIIDLYRAAISGSNGSFSFKLDTLTQGSGLDGASRPAWYVPGAAPGGSSATPGGSSGGPGGSSGGPAGSTAAPS